MKTFTENQFVNLRDIKPINLKTMEKSLLKKKMKLQDTQLFLIKSTLKFQIKELLSVDSNTLRRSGITPLKFLTKNSLILESKLSLLGFLLLDTKDQKNYLMTD